MNSVQNIFLPTHANVFRPWALGKISLTLFLMVTLAVEGFLVVGMIAQKSDDVFLSATTPQTDEMASVTSAAQTFMQTMTRQTSKIFTTYDVKKTTNVILGSIAVLLTLLVALAFFLHLDVQAHDMLLGGMVVAAIALVCLVGNTYYLSSTHMEAAVTQSL